MGTVLIEYILESFASGHHIVNDLLYNNYDVITVRKTEKRKDEAKTAEEGAQIAAMAVKSARIKADARKKKSEELKQKAGRKAEQAQVTLQ